MFDKLFNRCVTLERSLIPLDITQIKKRTDEDAIDAYFTLTYFSKRPAFLNRRFNKIVDVHTFYSYCQEDMYRVANTTRIYWHIMIPPSVKKMDESILTMTEENWTDFSFPDLWMDFDYRYPVPITDCLTLYGRKGSCAHKFAQSHKIPFVCVDFYGTEEEWSNYVDSL